MIYLTFIFYPFSKLKLDGFFDKRVQLSMKFKRSKKKTKQKRVYVIPCFSSLQFRNED